MNERGEYLINITAKNNRVDVRNTFCAKKFLNNRTDQLVGIMVQIKSPQDLNKTLETLKYAVLVPSLKLIEKKSDPVIKASMQQVRNEAKQKIVDAFVEICEKLGVTSAQPLKHLSIHALPFELDEIQAAVVAQLQEHQQAANHTPGF